ncbi:Acyl transferase domain-containing protein [Catalinimonas alkaloidigena]|uniref:Acyl transferase domain-containing protein n=1 Tax=Catalinimonas alkaloidigena TaxID=1075417 RepID=A0A1G9RRH1_9BACT|nr:type I polyketide synthase [Catalinimonas alkaloidigena]SDM25909.1 Acyl transferase domain-containing protein [Catalinimonas alkaloidigena]
MIHKEPIAVVGIGCRFPGDVHGASQYWAALQRSFDAITDVPEERWNLEAFYDPNPNVAGKTKSRKGGFVKNVDHFDADFFGLFPKEAERIDPQQRLLLEVTYEALEDAGIRLEDFSGSKTAVFMGVFMNDYWDIQIAHLQRDNITPHVPMGVSLTSIANRLSYVYNLKGPSVTLDTACSSSLVGVHQACRSIWSGESTQALAGGVNLMLRPESTIMMSKGNFLSPDGYCKSFDSRANGYVRSEGAGVVLLKPLSQAQADGDQIYALIRGSAVNQDGHTPEGFTVPSLEAQADMLRTAYQDAQVDPKEVAYVEAHGTGTPVGDPKETNAFGQVLSEKRTADEKLTIGSVKSNMGHLEAAAGIAGMIKLTMVLKNRQVPANLHFLKPNPNIPFDDYKLRVPTQLEDLPKEGTLFGGVNSFGAGGTNAHVVMQTYDAPTAQELPATDEGHDVHLFTLTARSREALRATAEKYVPFLEETPAALSDICFSAGTRRSAHPHRLSIAIRTKAELKASIEAFLRDETRPGMHYAEVTRETAPKVGFVFSGQGPQWYAMGQQLLQASPVFRETILEIEQHFAKVADWSLLEEMNRDEATSRVSDTRIAQPAIMAIQIALTELWKSWGVEPAGCVGHSIGEVAAAYAAGALTLAQAVEVIYHRSRGQNKATGAGKMLAVGLTLAEARKAIVGYEAVVSIAAINSPEMVTLSGDAEPLEAIAAALDKKDVFHRFLRVNVPFHSHHMNQLKDELIDSLVHLQPAAATLPLYSTVTGRREDGLHLTSHYWFQNVREPVYFTDAVQAMIDEGFDTFVEIAPHPVLSQGVQDLLKANQKEGLTVTSLRRKDDEAVVMMGSLGRLFTDGLALQWQKLATPGARYVKLPTYAWQKQRYWFETEAHRRERQGTTLHPFLVAKHQSATDAYRLLWDVRLDQRVFPYLEDHKVDGAIIFPGTGHLEVANAMAHASFPGTDFFLEDVHFESAVFLPDEGESPEVRMEVTSDEGTYVLCSRPRYSEDAAWTHHSRGKVNSFGDRFVKQTVSLDAVRERVTDPLSVSDFYVTLKEGGLQYGESFRCVQKMWRHGNELLSTISLSEKDLYGVEKYHVHPALLDASLHTILYFAQEQSDTGKGGIYLPVHIERFKVHQHPGHRLWCYVNLTEGNATYMHGDYCLFNEEGELVAEIQGLTCKYIEGSRGEQRDELYQGMYTYQWQLLEESELLATAKQALGTEPTNPAECTLLLADKGQVAMQLLRRFNAAHRSVALVMQSNQYQQLFGQHFEVDPLQQEDLEKVIRMVQAQGQPITRVVYLWGLDEAAAHELDTDAMAARQEQMALSAIQAVKAVVSQDIEPAFTFVTRGVEQLTEKDTQVNFAQGTLYGITRVMTNEYPFIPLRLIDLSAEWNEAELESLYDTIVEPKSLQKVRHTELALRGTQRYARRLEAVHQESAEQAATQRAEAIGTRYRAEVRDYGTFDRLAFRQAARPELAPNEVEIEVRAAGLNFKDVMNAMGLLSPEAVAGGIAEANLGLECSGVVTAVGCGVSDLRVGDPVMAWASNSFAGYTVAKRQCVVQKPENLSFEEAATLTVVYLTAYYSLHHLAHLEEGERVLIHSASGGVGLAAIQIARWRGAEVIATAGNEEKRNYLRALGVAHVFDSRDLRFADQILEVTNGEGVDVVLNSLTGKAIAQSIRCLAPFGRFVEIGKVDIYGDTKLGLKRFGENLSYHAVDLDRLMAQKPRLAQRMYRELADLLASEQIEALPFRTYPVSALSEALRFLSKGTHIGKVAVTMATQQVDVLPAETLSLPKDATYLITGGASGLGLEMAKWLASKGAQYLVLASRSGCKSDYDRQTIADLEAAGVCVRLPKVDITDEAAVRTMLAEVRALMPPLKGIIHSAAVLDDATLPNMDERRFHRVFHPKAMGAWTLHRATLHDTLDFFLTISSVSAIFGLPGQSNYSAANNFLDKLCAYRQAQGLAAASVNLGVLDTYAGMSKEGEHVLKVLGSQGWQPMPLQRVLNQIENIVLQQPSHRMAALLDWKRFREFFPHQVNDARFAHLLSQESLRSRGGNGQVTLVDQLLAASGEAQTEMLQNKLAESLAKILGTSVDKIQTDISISKIGLDSLMLNQFRNWIQQKLELNFPLMKIAKGPSLLELANQLLQELTHEEAGEEASVAVATDVSGIAGEEELEVVDTWFIRNRTNTQDIQTRVFCIHPVGAGASIFSHFLYHPPAHTDVMAIQLPGRENRRNETPYEDMPRLIADLAQAIQPYLDKPFVVMGHSFGGVVGFELVRHLRRQGGPQPMRLLLTGTIPPHLTPLWREKESIRETAVFTNSEEKILSLLNYIDDVDFLKQILPVMKKDMPLIMSYYYHEEAPFPFPVTVFAADQDEVVEMEEIQHWRDQTTGDFTLEVVEGDHWFLSRNQERILACLSELIHAERAQNIA